MATATAPKVGTQVGKIVQIIGPVVDVEFEAGHLPQIYNALQIVSDGKGGGAVLDVICAAKNAAFDSSSAR